MVTLKVAGIGYNALHPASGRSISHMRFLSPADQAALRAPRGGKSPFSIGNLGSTPAGNLAMFECLRNYLEEASTPRKILDLGTGSGALIQAVAELYESKGWPASEYLLAADINDGKFQAKVPFRKIDLFQPLNLHGQTFDLIIAQEVLEHIRRAYLLLEEIRAALNPGGRLLFSVPNIMHMKSRLRFLISGRFYNYYAPSHEIEDIGACHGHINPLPVQYWDYGLRFAGFSDVRYRTDRLKRGSIGLSLLFAPVLWIGTRLLHKQERKHSERIYRQNARPFAEINTLRNLAGLGLIAECSVPDLRT